MPQLNWTRGFIRLWLAVSALYVAAALSVSGFDVFRPLWRPAPTYEIELKTGGRYFFDSSKRTRELRRDIEDAQKQDAASFAVRGDDRRAAEIRAEIRTGKLTEELLAHVTQENARLYERFYWALGGVVGPPLGLLIFGALIGWILSGFRGAPSEAKVS